MSTRRPLIGIPADRHLLGPHYCHCVGEKYIAVVAEGAQAVPVLIPSLGEGLEARELLADFDGILLTRSPLKAEPHRYNGPGCSGIPGGSSRTTLFRARCSLILAKPRASVPASVRQGDV